MKKRMTIMIVALAIVFGGIILFNIVKGFLIRSFFANFKPPAVTVSSVVAKEKDWHPKLSAVGNFVALNGVEVNSQASGNVVNIHFESGQFIEKDKPLIDIDDRIEQASLKFNQAQLALKEINFKRQTELFKRAATPGSSVDEARANLEQAQADIEKIQTQINQKHITAPFSGRLGIRQVNLGQFVTPGQTSIVTLQSLDPLFIEFYLPEQFFKKLQVGQSILLSVEQFPNLLFPGKINAINSKIDPNTHNIQVQATLANCPTKAMSDPKKSSLVTTEGAPGSKTIVKCNSDLNTKNKIDSFIFIPGMFAAISIEQPSIANAIILPATAISYSLYGNAVFIIEKDKDGKKDEHGKDLLSVRRQFVVTGEQRGNEIVIKKGIKPGQLVVSSGELKLQNGARVVINNDVQLNTESNPELLSQ
jgi:membrane fusion protein (multidrug efflux system)